VTGSAFVRWLVRPDPNRCTAAVAVDWAANRVTTRSCRTGRPLLDLGTCDIGCCDRFECPDCGHSFTIEWPD
jgi:hypothetical protein